MGQTQEEYEKEKFINNCNILKTELLACFNEEKSASYEKEMDLYMVATFLYKEFAVNGCKEIVPLLLNEDVSLLTKKERFKLAYDFFKVVIKSHEKNVLMNFELDLFDGSFSVPSLEKSRKNKI